jgi:hypothetical protein
MCDKIDKNDALKIYALTNNDLTGIPSTYNNNTGTMDYLIADIEKRAIEKYGSPQKVMAEVKSRRLRLDEKIKRKRQDENSRRAELLKKLRLEKVEKIDLNSPQCNNYIINNIGNLNDIVNDIAEREFYMKHTNYKAIFSKLRSHWYTDLNVYSHDDLEVIAKNEALKQFTITYIDDPRVVEHLIPNSLRDQVHNYNLKYYKKTEAVNVALDVDMILEEY